MNSLFTHNIFPKGEIDFYFLFSFFRLDYVDSSSTLVGVDSSSSSMVGD